MPTLNDSVSVSVEDTVKPRVIHIDDNPDFLDIFRFTYGSLLTITSVSNASEAFEAIKKTNYDVIITDYDMPGINGLEFLEILKKNYINIPVIFFTGQGNEAVAREAFLSGAADYFTKDFVGFAYKERFLNSIKRAMEIRKLEEARKSAERNYRLVCESMDEGIIIQDRNSIITYVNKSLCRILGYESNEMIGKLVQDFLTDEGKGQYSKSLAKRMLGVNETFQNSWKGKERIVHTVVSPAAIFDNNKNYIGSFSIVTDISKQIEIENELKRNEKKLSHLNRVLRAIRNVNQLIVQEKDGNALIKKACKMLTETKGYKNAWIIIVDKNNKPIPDKSYGYGPEYNKLLKIILTGKLPECTKQIKDPKKVIFCKGTNFESCPLPELCYNDIRAVTCLHHKNRTFGYISVAIPDYEEDKEEEKLFLEVAGDIAYALHNIDIAEKKKKADEMLRLEKNRAEQYLDVVGVIIVVLDPKGKITLINKKGCEILDYPQEKLIGKNWFDTVIVPEDKDVLKSVFKKILSGNMEPVEYFENYVVTSSGEKRLIRWHNNYLKDTNGNIYSTLSAGEDITNLKLMEEELLKERTNFLKLIKTIHEGIWIIDKDANTTYVNDYMAQMLGYTAKEMIGKRLFSFMEEDEVAKCEELLERRKKGIKEQHDFKFRKKDGSIIYTIVGASDITDSKGNYEGAIAVVTDVSEQKRLLLELIAKNKELEDFTYRVSHNLKALINKIKRLILMFKEQPELYENLVNRITKHIEHLSEYIDDLLRFSKRERKKS